MTRIVLILTAACSLLLLSGPAETAPPPSVCDGLSGQAFGLCNAYCVALACEDDPTAPAKACEQKFDAFESLTGSAPPCAVPSCPCFDADDLLAADIQWCGSVDPSGTLSTFESACVGASGEGFTISASRGSDKSCASPTEPAPILLDLQEEAVCYDLLVDACVTLGLCSP